MKNKMKNQLVSILLSLILVVISYLFLKDSIIYHNLLNTRYNLTSKLDNNLSMIGTHFTSSYNNLLTENINLRNYQNNLSILNKQIISLEQELDLLKESLNLKEVYNSFEVINAKVIERPLNTFNDYLIIDIGSNKDIKPSDAVITNKGLVGVVNKVFKDTSEVKLITSHKSTTSVSVIKDDKVYQGIISNYKNDCLIVTGLSSYDDIITNSKVVTSGLGSLPFNLNIGLVKEITYDNYETSKILRVKPDNNFNDLKYVAVLRSD